MIGLGLGERRSLNELVDEFVDAERRGFASAWVPQGAGAPLVETKRSRRRAQTHGYDAMTVLAVTARHTSTLRLGSGVVPLCGRHPLHLAEQAVTVQAAASGRLVLGIGVSHRELVESRWGTTLDQPLTEMREALHVLRSVFESGAVDFRGETVTARGAVPVPGSTDVPILLGALGPKMIELAGSLADGAVTWMVGTAGVRDYIRPCLDAAAEAAGRPVPDLTVCTPICVTDDRDRARTTINRMYALYTLLPFYRRVLDRTGCSEPADVAMIGDEDEVRDMLAELAAAGVTEYTAALIGEDEDRRRTTALLESVIRRSSN